MRSITTIACAILLSGCMACLHAEDLPPTIATIAAATPAVVVGKTTKLTVLGTDDGGAATLLYMWSASGPATVTFSTTNGTNAAKTLTATFRAIGSYTLTATITDTAGQMVTSSIPVTVSATLTTLTVAPTTAAVNPAATKNIVATPKDQFGIIMADVPVTWAAIGAGSVDAAGLFTAGSTPGPASVMATAGAKTATSSIRVNATPTVVNAAATSTPTVVGKTATFTALGADDVSADLLTYTWSATGPKTVSFSPRSSTAGETTTATFAAAGSYEITATILDKEGLSVSSSTTVTVQQTSTSLAITPTTAVAVNPGATKAFAATVKDQFAALMTPQPVVTWSVSAGPGSIDAAGIYTAAEPSGSATITASVGVATGSVTLRINAAPTVATAAATVTPEVTGKTSVFTVQGADDVSVDLLTYTWSATGPKAVSFAPRSSTAGETTTATFGAAGSYVVTATISDKEGLTASSATTVTVYQTPTGLTIAPSTNLVVNPSANKAFTATVKDQFNTLMAEQPAVAWAVTAGPGSIDAAGIYTAAEPSGSATITASVGVATGSVTLRINAAPTVATAVSTDTPVVTGKTAICTVQGGDDVSVDLLTYAWTATSSTGKSVNFSPRSSTHGETTTATFAAAGTYTITATITDKEGLSVPSSTTVTVQQTSTSLAIAPTSTVVVNPGLTKPFIATVKDQFAALMLPQPIPTWAVVSGSGTIGSDGIFIAGTPGPAVVSASVGPVTTSVTLRVNAPPTVAEPVSTATTVIAGTTAAFSVQGADDDLVDLLSYRWTATGPKTVTFVPRSGITAESTTATFAAAGSYTITATITDKQGLQTTSSLAVTVVQVPTALALNAATAVLNPKAAKVFAVQQRDQFNAVIAGATIPGVTWSATGGTIDAAGRYVAGLVPGQAMVTASVATDPITTLTAEVRINAAPTVATAPATTGPNPTTLTSIPLVVLGADDGGAANIRYTWSVIGPMAPGVTFSGATQNTTAAQAITATVPGSGTYPFRVLIRDAQGLSVTADVSVTVATAITPEITWSSPSAIVYTTPLSTAQLNASSPVDGVFSYDPPAGTVLTAGPHVLTTTFTPTDTASYITTTASVTLEVTPATPVLTWPAVAPIVWNTAVGAAQQTASAPMAGSYVYTPPAGTVLEVGAQTLSVVFTPTDPNYGPAIASTTIQVLKAQPVLTWAAPAPIQLGAALGAAQCNAQTVLAGSIAYVPAQGTILTAGIHVLRATFTPTDSAHYTAAQATVTLQVIDPTPPTTTYAYDNANRLTDRIYQDGKHDVFTYDDAGRLTQAVSQRYGNTVKRFYDAAGRLVTEQVIMDGSTREVGYGYDNANRLTEQTYPDTSVVGRTYTARNQLESVTWNGDPVIGRTYDDGGRLSTTTYGQQVQTETRTYEPGSSMVATIKVPGVTDFSYAYDTVWRKQTESDLLDTGRSQHFRYDDANRLTDWRQGPTFAAPTTSRSWDLSLVGDWENTTADGQTEARLHTPVHEISSINGTSLEHDYRGNLSRGLPYADGTDARYVWDVENRLASATASDADMGSTGTATYRYDALGRRVGKTVWGETTTYIHAGAQVVQTTTAPVQLPPAVADDDGDLVAANGRPPGAAYLGGGGILEQAQQRVNFQPELLAIPTGFVADKGRVQGSRSNTLTYGWDVAQMGAVERRAFPLPQFDTHLRMQPDGQATAGSWSIALPNGTYAVVVVMGDPSSRNQTNDIQLNGVACLDATPATTEIEYRLGNFDGYIENVTVTDGFLHVAALSTAFDPKLCFIEIGVEGVLATEAERTRLAAVIEAANNQTAKNRPVSADTASYVYGAYVDEVLCYQQTVGNVVSRYYPHYNHLYSVAALTDSAGAVVERYSYDAYGKQKITAPVGGVVRESSSIRWDRGFVGYIKDEESTIYLARARMYSPSFGRFLGRDPLSYVDGSSLYGAYYCPNSVDPLGLFQYSDLLDPAIDGSIYSRICSVFERAALPVPFGKFQWETGWVWRNGPNGVVDDNVVQGPESVSQGDGSVHPWPDDMTGVFGMVHSHPTTGIIGSGHWFSNQDMFSFINKMRNNEQLRLQVLVQQDSSAGNKCCRDGKQMESKIVTVVVWSEKIDFRNADPRKVMGHGNAMLNGNALSYWQQLVNGGMDGNEATGLALGELVKRGQIARTSKKEVSCDNTFYSDHPVVLPFSPFDSFPGSAK